MTSMVLFVVYSFIGTIVFGIFIYYATRPLYRRLHPQIRSESLAAAVSLSGLALPVVLLLLYTTAIALQEFRTVAETVSLGVYEEVVQPYLNVSVMVSDPATLLQRTDGELLRATFQQVLTSIEFVGGGLLHLFLMFAIAFYLLRDGHRLSRWFHQQFAPGGGIVETCTEAVDNDLHAIFFGTLLHAILTAAIGALVYSLLAVVSFGGASVPYPALLGLLTGVASLVPVVGAKLVYVPTTTYLIVDGLDAGSVVFAVLFGLVSLVVVDSIPDLVIRPYVSARRLHVGLVMFAYILGPLLFGWYGIFLGPMLLVVIVHSAKYILPPLLEGEPV